MKEDTAETRLARTRFIVEANSFEQLTLWQQHCSTARPQYFKGYQKVKWDETPFRFGPSGWLVTVGTLDKRPVCINVNWARLNGVLVMFWDACSQVTDSVMIEKWLKENFTGTYDNGTRRASCDAMNFGHCLSAIEEAKER